MYRGCPYTRMGRERMGIGKNLECQFTRGCEHEGPSGPPRLVHELMQNGKEECRGLPTSRRSAGEKVPASEGLGDRLFLNGGWAYEAQVLDASKKGRVQIKCSKSHGMSG